MDPHAAAQDQTLPTQRRDRRRGDIMTARNVSTPAGVVAGRRSEDRIFLSPPSELMTLP